MCYVCVISVRLQIFHVALAFSRSRYCIVFFVCRSVTYRKCMRMLLIVSRDLLCCNCNTREKSCLVALNNVSNIIGLFCIVFRHNGGERTFGWSVLWQNISNNEANWISCSGSRTYVNSLFKELLFLYSTGCDIKTRKLNKIKFLKNYYIYFAMFFSV